MIKLSRRTLENLHAIFKEKDFAEAERLLVHECAETIIGYGEDATPESLERIRFAALRCSGGTMQGLRDALDMAHTDWRDLLVNAGFGRDIHGHERWVPRRFDLSMVDAWLGGSHLEGVEFAVNDPVEIIAGWQKGKRGFVITLVGLEPGPRYMVELVSAKDVEVFQANMILVKD